MKRVLGVFLALVFIGTTEVVASPVGNPTEMRSGDEAGFAAGAEGSLVFDRDLESRDAEIDHLNDLYGKVSYTLEEFPLEFYGLLGTMQFEVDERNDSSYETDYGFAYGIGAKMKIWEGDEGTAVGIDAKYRRSEPDIDEAVRNGVPVNMDDVTYEDWQTALGVSHKLNEKLTPYGGIKLSDVDISSVGAFSEQESDDIFGIFAGLVYAVKEDLDVNVETQLVNETAISGSVSWWF